MALLLQLVDRASPIRPSPWAVWPLATPRVDQYMALCTSPLSLASHALKHQSEASHIYDRCPLGGLSHPHFVAVSIHKVLQLLILQVVPYIRPVLSVLYLHTKSGRISTIYNILKLYNEHKILSIFHLTSGPILNQAAVANQGPHDNSSRYRDSLLCTMTSNPNEKTT